MVKISIIMPVYNASDFLETSINSVLNQTIDDIELICVNDGSTDNSLEILEKYASKHDFIKIFNQKNSGPGPARNRGMLEAKGEYLAFLDSDDIFLNDEALSIMYNIAIKNDANMVGANLRRINLNLEIEEKYDYKNAQVTYFTKEEIIPPQDYGIPWACYKNIYKRKFITDNNIIFPNLISGEDPIFLANILILVDKIFTIPLDFYGYNHLVGGGLNIKLNNYKKKRDYVKHYLESFEILNKKNFEKVLYNYKKEFIDYLNFRDNINDNDLKEIISELFVGENFFKKSEYGYLIIELLRNNLLDHNEDYEFIKYCIFEESILEDNFIDIDRLKDFENISDIKDINKQKLSFNQLKQIEMNTFEEKRQINGKVDRLKIDIAHFIKSNHLILTSNSWKVTGLLRSLKHNHGD